MKFCINCGTQLEDNALFCTVCGANQIVQNQQVQQPQPVQQLQQPQQPQYGQQVQMPYGQPQYGQQQYVQPQYIQPQQVQPQYVQPQAFSAGAGKPEERKKGKKKFFIIPLIVVLLAAIGAGAFFLFFRKNQTDPTEKQIQVLDAYFEAMSAMDFDTIYRLNAPDSDERFNVGTDRVSLTELLTDKYGYYRGIFDQSTYMFGRFREMFMKSYGFPDCDLDDYREVNKDPDLFREHYKDFEAEYDLISLENASEYEISYGNGRRTVDDMAEYIADKMDLYVDDVDDVYVAKIHIYWNYGDKKYGYDKSWWNDEKFKEIMGESGPYDENAGKKAQTYEEYVDYYDNLEYDVFLYEVDGEWYIYNINMRDEGYGWSVD